MLITSREYKVIVDSSWFVDFDTAKVRVLDDIFDDTEDLAQALRLPIEGAFDEPSPKNAPYASLTPRITHCARTACSSRARRSRQGHNRVYAQTSHRRSLHRRR